MDMMFDDEIHEDYEFSLVQPKKELENVNQLSSSTKMMIDSKGNESLILGTINPITLKSERKSTIKASSKPGRGELCKVVGQCDM